MLLLFFSQMVSLVTQVPATALVLSEATVVMGVATVDREAVGARQDLACMR